MIAYVDASAAIRVLFGAPHAYAGWREIDRAVTSTLVEVECLRMVDRLRLRGVLDDEQLAVRRAAVFAFLSQSELVEVDAEVLRRAASPLPTELGSLDAIHLASAMMWREATGEAIQLLTHDLQLARAARSVGLEVLGV